MLAGGLCLSTARADECHFTYTYEPELLPAGAMEFEQLMTLRTQHTSGDDVKQGNFNLWEIREELAYGVTDNYSDPAAYSDAEWRFWMKKMSKKARLKPDQEQLLARYLGAIRISPHPGKNGTKPEP